MDGEPLRLSVTLAMSRPLALIAWLVAALLAGPVFAQQQGAYQAQTAALASNLVIATGADRKLVNLDVTADSTLDAAAWFVLVYDAAALPADGSVTPNFCYPVPTGTAGFTKAFGTDGPRFQTGIVAVASTTGCFTQTKSAHAFIAATFQ